MAASHQNTRSPVREGVVGFMLGAVGGCALGVTETPADQAMAEIITGSLLKPITDGVKTVGPLGLGTLLGATAITSAMTTAIAGVSGAALAALLLIRLKSNGVAGLGGFEWLTAGLVAALSTTACGAALGFAIEHLTRKSGIVALLWALGIFTILKMLVHVSVQLTCREMESHSLLQLSTGAQEWEQSRLEAMEAEQRERVTVEIEQRIIALETKNGEEGPEHRAAWEAHRQEREEMERLRKEAGEQRTVQQRLTNLMPKYVEYLAFSGIPMTVTAVVTAGFGIFGYGEYRFVFVILLTLVLCMAFMLMRSMHLHFWMFTGCVGMFATFATAVLTVHAGQEAAGLALRMQQVGQMLSNETIVVQMDHRSSLEAIAAGFFVSKVCQVGLGATVGGPLNPKVLDKAIVGGCVATVAILSIVEASSVILGVGGVTGALLGAVGAAGLSLGAAAAVAVQCSSWAGTISTTAGMLFAALAIGKWNIVNTGLHVLVAYMFAMINPY
ncbi:uncharacterized protein LOC113572190 [Electrophorus electricus]|uniref:uncharacterized protein LOC113572190 n=1 Tax=Electrophorus electricus TaxID=8005 RepID=UPI0015CFDC85|nr:uncharacterized protein LOC113572190 [Electrophorus electricus]